MRIRVNHISIAAVLLTLVSVGLLLVFYGSAAAVVQEQPRLHIAPFEDLVLSAASAFVIDVEAGVPLYEKDPDTQRPIASVTKLVSSALFYELATGTATTTVTWEDVRTEGRSGRLAAGDQYRNQELLFPALLESSNDAASTMQRVAPVDLVSAMNSYTQEKGLHQTSFIDASGLGSQNISTARELTALGVELHAQYPHVFDVTQLHQYLADVNAWMNNNPFAHDVGYAGGKHGYTYEAQKTALSFFDESLASGAVRRVVYVLLGSEDLSSDMALLRSHVQENIDYK